MNKNLLIEIFGWYGAIGLVGAYVLSSFGILTPENVWYQVINITSALGIIIVSFHKKIYQTGALNIIWVVIGIISLIKILL